MDSLGRIRIGYFILVNIDGFKDIWTTWYNAPIAPLTRFNNTVVMGSFICALILSPFVYYGMKKFVVAYRATIGKRLENTKIYKAINNSWIVQTYQRIRGMVV